MKKVAQERRRESIFSRFPVLNNVYDYITRHKAYSSVGDLPAKDKIFASDDPAIDSSSLAHVTTEDQDGDGNVDIIRINVAKVSEDLSSFSQDKSRKVEEILRKAETTPDAVEFYEGFENDLTDYINLLLKFFRIFRHEQIHLEGQKTGGGFLEESATVSQEDREAEAYYKAYRESLPAIIKNMLKENLTKSSNLNISGSKKMLNNLKKVYASLLEKQEFELAKEAYNLIREFKKTAQFEASESSYMGAEEQAPFDEFAIRILNPRQPMALVETALADMVRYYERLEPSETIRKIYAKYYPALLAAKTMIAGLHGSLGEYTSTDLNMALKEFEEANLMEYSSNPTVQTMAKKLLDSTREFVEENEDSGYIPASILKEESSNSKIKKEASSKVSFKDIQNEFTIFTRNTSLKTYGR